jgi:hypothetical protein
VSNSFLGYQLLPYLRAHFPDTAFVDFIHMEEEYWRCGGYPRYSINYQSQLDKTIVSSHHLKGWMTERGGDAKKIEVCYTNRDADYWSRSRFDCSSLRREWGVTEELPVILYAGRLAEQKQPDVFAEVMLRLANRGVGFQALVAGDGPQKQWLEEYLEREGLQQVRMLGPVPSESMVELMAVSDVFFLPSKMEGIALVLFEAMAMEMVPVGADVGGQSELVTPECGILIDRDDSEVSAYVEALSELLADGQRRRRMAAAGRERIVKHFDLEDMGRRMVELFEQAMACAKSNPAPAPPLPLAVTLATEAIEQMRVNIAVDEMWRDRNEFISQFKNAHLQVYLAKNGPYCEENSIRLPLNGQSSAVLTLRAECGLGDGAVRIDPSDIPGMVWIDSITVRLVHTEEVVWNAAAKADFAAVSITGTAVRFPLGEEQGLCVLSYGNDPQVILPVFPGQPVDKPALIEIRLRLEPLHGLDGSLLVKSISDHKWKSRIKRLKCWLQEIL